jgi:hypothetical protein
MYATRYSAHERCQLWCVEMVTRILWLWLGHLVTGVALHMHSCRQEEAALRACPALRAGVGCYCLLALRARCCHHFHKYTCDCLQAGSTCTVQTLQIRNLQIECTHFFGTVTFSQRARVQVLLFMRLFCSECYYLDTCRSVQRRFHVQLASSLQPEALTKKRSTVYVLL